MKQTLDSKLWLYERFLDAKKRNQKVSMRSFAKKLEVSTSTVSEIFNGKRLVTEKLAERFSKKLLLDTAQRQNLMRAVKLTLSKAELPDDDEVISATDGMFQKIDLGTFELLSQWYYLAMLEAANIKPNRFSVGWFTSRFPIDRAQARSAMKTLENLGLVVRDRLGFKLGGNPVSIETKGYESAIKRFLKQHLTRASEALDSVPAEEREICSMTIAIDPKNIEKARKKIKRFRRELSECLEEGQQSRVYSLSLQLFPLDQLEAKL